MQLSENFLNFIEKLNASSTQYLLVGGFAVISYGHNRTTGDMDLWINCTDKNLKRFRDSLLTENYHEADIDEAIEALRKNMKLSVWLEDDLIELLPVYSSILSFEDAYAKCKKLELTEHIVIPVIDIDHLIDTKIKAGRDKDLWDATELKKRR